MTPTPSPTKPIYYYLTNLLNCGTCEITVPSVYTVYSYIPLTIGYYYSYLSGSDTFQILSITTGPQTIPDSDLTYVIGFDNCSDSCPEI
jgi:hypothetical protein